MLSTTLKPNFLCYLSQYAQNEGGQIFETNEYNVAETYDFRTSLRGYIIPGDYVLTLHEHLSGPYTALLEKEELACRVFGWDLTITVSGSDTDN